MLFLLVFTNSLCVIESRVLYKRSKEREWLSLGVYNQNQKIYTWRNSQCLNTELCSFMYKSLPTHHQWPMLNSSLDPSIPSWTIWASHPSGLHTWNSDEEDNHCLLDNDLLRAYCVSYSFTIIRFIRIKYGLISQAALWSRHVNK